MTNEAVFDLTHPSPAPKPLARVYGEPLNEMPTDLYIPPEALEVFLESFEGPLDLLLYLIRKQNINVLDIPMAELTRQYLGYVEMMRRTQLELAAEYLLMAAVLIEIKSRLLLPRPPAQVGEEGEDPRAELVRRLLEYERMKAAALAIDALPLADRDFATVRIWFERVATAQLPNVAPDDLKAAWAAIIEHPQHAKRESMLQLFDTMPSELTLTWADPSLTTQWKSIMDDPNHPRRAEVVAQLKQFSDRLNNRYKGPTAADDKLRDRIRWTLFFQENYRKIASELR